MKNENPMKEVQLEKITLNIGTGGPGDKLEKAMKLLSKISEGKPVITKTKKRIPTWGLRPGLEIGCMITLRGEKAEELLKRLFIGVDNKLPATKFDKSGNFSFGIGEYLHIPKVEYDSTIGIIGLEVAVTLKRRGFRVKRRLIRPARIAKAHRITKAEAIDYVKSKYGVDVA